MINTSLKKIAVVIIIGGALAGCGAVQQTEQAIQPYIFDNGPDYFVEGLARFVENGKIGFYNEKNEKIIQAQFDWASPFENGLAQVCNGCKEVQQDEHKTLKGGVLGTVNLRGEVTWEK